MTHEQADLVAALVVNTILDNGLADSTWRDVYPSAYRDLLPYREDMQKQVSVKLERLEIK